VPHLSSILLLLKRVAPPGGPVALEASALVDGNQAERSCPHVAPGLADSC